MLLDKNLTMPLLKAIYKCLEMLKCEMLDFGLRLVEQLCADEFVFDVAACGLPVTNRV